MYELEDRAWRIENLFHRVIAGRDRDRNRLLAREIASYPESERKAAREAILQMEARYVEILKQAVPDHATLVQMLRNNMPLPHKP